MPEKLTRHEHPTCNRKAVGSNPTSGSKATVSPVKPTLAESEISTLLDSDCYAMARRGSSSPQWLPSGSRR